VPAEELDPVPLQAVTRNAANTTAVDGATMYGLIFIGQASSLVVLGASRAAANPDISQHQFFPSR
jgi:hypothetical protein